MSMALQYIVSMFTFSSSSVRSIFAIYDRKQKRMIIKNSHIQKITDMAWAFNANTNKIIVTIRSFIREKRAFEQSIKPFSVLAKGSETSSSSNRFMKKEKHWILHQISL